MLLYVNPLQLVQDDLIKNTATLRKFFNVDTCSGEDDDASEDDKDISENYDWYYISRYSGATECRADYSCI